MPKKHQHSANSLNNVSSLQAKKSISEFLRLFSSTVLSFVQNPDTSIIFALEIRASGKVKNVAHKFIGKCNNPQRSYLNDSPDMNKIMLFMQSNGIHLLSIKFDSDKEHIHLDKILRSPSLKDVQIFDSICRDNDLAFRTDLYKIILSVLKDKIPQRYIDLLSVITEPEAHTLEDIVKSLNSRQRPVSPLTSHKQILMVDEILEILSEDLVILLVLDISVNKQYLRITKQFKDTSECSLPEVVFEPLLLRAPVLYIHEMLKAFINFLENDERKIIFKFTTEPPSYFIKIYAKIKLFVNDRKQVFGIWKDLKTEISLYRQLEELVYCGPDFGIVDNFSIDNKSITITKEPRFMTETTIYNRNEQWKNIFNLNTNVTHCNVSDESNDESTYTGTTDTGSIYTDTSAKDTGTTYTDTTVTGITDNGTIDTNTKDTCTTYTGITVTDTSVTSTYDTGTTVTGTTDTGTTGSSTKGTGTTSTSFTNTGATYIGTTDAGTTDTSTKVTGTTYTGTTDTGEITQVFYTCDTLEDKLYQLRNSTINNIKLFIKTVNRTRDDVWLKKFAQKCKFLVTLECFLRESDKVKMNLLTENGFLVATTFSNDVLKNFNAGTQCSFTKNALLSNLFQRLRKYDYCILRTEYLPRKVIITKKIKNVKKYNTNEKSIILNSDVGEYDNRGEVKACNKRICNDKEEIADITYLEYTILLTNETLFLDDDRRIPTSIL